LGYEQNKFDFFALTLERGADKSREMWEPSNLIFPALAISPMYEYKFLSAITLDGSDYLLAGICWMRQHRSSGGKKSDRRLCNNRASGT